LGNLTRTPTKEAGMLRTVVLAASDNIEAAGL
jgi:hypothetical protein